MASIGQHDVNPDRNGDTKKALDACQQTATLLANTGSSCLNALCRSAQILSYQAGMVVHNEQPPIPAVVPPIALFPSPVPREQLHKVQKLGPVFSRLIDRVSLDVEWLMRCTASLRSADAGDPWNARLLKLADEVYGKGTIKKDPKADVARLLLMRQDYLPHQDGRHLQVEINSIAVAFAGLTEQLAKVHSNMLRRHCPGIPESAGELMENNAPGRDYAQALAAAHNIYMQSIAEERSSDTAGHGPRVCFYCFPEDHLESDQVHIEDALNKLGVPSFFAFLGANMELKGGDSSREGVGGALMIDGIEASVVYFHCTFSPAHFKNETDWNNRKLIELSRAVKAPTLLGHMAGLKKIQQVLADERELSRFLLPDEVQNSLSVFARQVDPSQPDAESLVTAAKQEPDKWVLKPQREGGGNNFYGNDLVKILLEGNGLAQYVLMEKIQSLPMPCLMMKKPGIGEQVDACSELGVFSAYLACGDKEIQNTVGGAMLRTKMYSCEEGGVCAGFGVVDTPFVVP